jgi:thiamine-phosphate pyrophosphorylase
VRLPDPPLLVITDRRQARRPLEDIAEAAFAAGCRWLSLREKDLSPADRLALLRRLVAIGRRYGAIVGINDDLPAALAAGAGAIHFPDPTLVVPAKAGTQSNRDPRMLVGMSAHDSAGIARAAAQGADYATLSPIFVSASKPDYPAIGLGLLAAAPLPLVALGGIDECNLASVIAAGASGVAVMGEAMRADDPQRVIAALVARLRHALVARGDASHSSANTMQKGSEP